MEHSQTLPYASSLCGACYEVCPVKINIPEILVHLRGKVVERGAAPLLERMAMKAAGYFLDNSGRLGSAQKWARWLQIPFSHDGVIRNLPGLLANWTTVRDLPAVPKETFREWWVKNKKLKYQALNRELLKLEAAKQEDGKTTETKEPEIDDTEIPAWTKRAETGISNSEKPE
jgi:heterodisulfide reductase subunit C